MHTLTWWFRVIVNLLSNMQTASAFPFRLVKTVEGWSLPKGTEKSLTSKLEAAYHLLINDNRNAALRHLTVFVRKVEALREKKLTNEQADHLIARAQRIINLIEE